jgi:hypothetical protein
MHKFKAPVSSPKTKSIEKKHRWYTDEEDKMLKQKGWKWCALQFPHRSAMAWKVHEKRLKVDDEQYH